ncbi:hypothetical protein SBA2_580012 [Acidobacteriia bacterium SbA2]|nr:hypothetical protein SBA2_580012 [Acidobacteriia bacterium SbA2]
MKDLGNYLWFRGSRTTAEILRAVYPERSERAQDDTVPQVDTFWVLLRLLATHAPPAREQVTPRPASSG